MWGRRLFRKAVDDSTDWGGRGVEDLLDKQITKKGIVVGRI